MTGKTLLSCKSILIRSLPTVVLCWILLAALLLRAQTPPAAGSVSGTVQPPIPGAGHDYIHLLSETVNPSTGNLTVRIELPAPKGRGISPPAIVAYNSGELDSLIEPGGQLLWATSTENPMGQATGWGAPTSLPLSIGASEWNFTSPEPPQGWSEVQNCNSATGYSFTDLNGTSHTLGIGGETLATNNGNGGQCNTNMVNTGASDGQTTGELDSSAQQELANGYAPGVNVIDMYGNTYSGSPGADGAGTLTMEDRNGNQITPGSWTLQNGVWQPTGTDTAARSMPLQIPAVAGTYNVYGLQYTIATESISLNYTPQESLTIEEGASNCNVTGVFAANSANITVISSITLPNGQKYQFQYDPTYGTIDEIDYPGGGKITYSWGLTSGSYNQVASFPAKQSGTGMPMNNACTVQYQTPVVVGRTIYFDGSNDVQYQGFYYTTTWNQTTWTQKTAESTTTDAVTGKSFDTVWQYSPTANDVAAPFNTANYPTVPMEQEVQHYDWGTSVVLDTVTEAWYNQYQKACEVHTLDNGQSYGHFYMWQYGFISDDKEYDFNSVSGLANYCTPTSYAPPSITPTRETVTTFQQFTSPVPPNLSFGKPQKVAVYANGAEIAEIDYGYDQFATEPIAGLTSHDETYFKATVSAGRGNATTVTRKCFGCSQGDSVTTYHYDETGQVIAMTDACGNGSCSLDMSAGSPPACFSYSTFSPTSHTTCYSYADSPSNGGQTDAYLTGIAYPSTKTAHTESFTWNYEQGELTSSTDQNNQKTTYQYNDSLARLTETQGPPDPNNGNQQATTTISYNDSAPNPSVTTSELLNTSGTSKTTVAVMDGIGHTIQTQTTSDAQGTDYVDTTYDGEGRVYTQSNPHRSASSPSDGTTTFYYDVLGRNVATVHPDSTYATNCYNGIASSVPSGISVKCNSQIGLSSGSWVDSTDEQGNTWQRSSDAFGDLMEAVEPNGSSQTPSMQTLYTYDGLGDLLSVVQHGDSSGDRDRYFAYDSLGRLLATMNPENAGSLNSPQPGYTAPPALSCTGASNPLYSGAWTTCYTYDVNGNLTSKEDNRQITTNYSYDNLNRLTLKHYSDGVTPNNGFGYDGYDDNGTALTGLTNVNGRLTQSSNQINAASRYSYDVMGRTLNRYECIPGDCSLDIDVQAHYDLAGNPISLTNGSLQQPIILTYMYDGVARLSSITSSWAPDCNHPTVLFSSPGYGPVGLTSATLGTLNSGCPSNSTNSLSETRSYDNRTRIASESYNATAMAATAPTGTISIPSSDSEQSMVVGQAAGTGWISIGGGEQSTTIYVQCGPYGQQCPQTIYDSGTVTATINGTQYTIGYGQGDTTSTVAAHLASNINGSLVSATASGSTVYLTALTTGSQTNYSLSVTSATNIPQYFSSSSFPVSASGSSLTGGSNGTTVYDTGTITATVNGVQAQANWGQGDTPSTMASKLASSIQGQMGSFLTASSTGGSITLQSNSTDYWPISVSWTDTNTQYFSSPSFTASASGMNANSTGGTAYSYSVGYDGVGNVTSLGDSVMGSWTYQYDTLNRLLTTGQVSGGPYNGDYGCWTYDGFGNRTMEATSGTACNSSPSPISWAHYNTNNQITGTGSMTSGNYYDAAGDVTNDGFNQYLYDGAGRICAVENISTGALTGYVYDGEGNRVAKGGLSSFSCNMSSNGFSASTQYVLGIGGEQLTEQDGSNNWKHTNVFAGGALLATYGGASQSSDTYFALTDWQGTKRAQTGVGGCLTGWSSLPYGNNGTSSGPIPVSINGAVQCGLDATEHHYTGKIHDSETGNDDFGARYYASTAARWFSPDWAAAAEAVPYASYGSPQTLDLYAFVGNNPLSHVDPDGHQNYRVTCSDGVAGQCGMGTDPFESGIFSADGMGQGLSGADPVTGQNNIQETSYDTWLANAQAQQQNSSSSTSTTDQREQHQYDLVVERTNKLLGTTDAADHIDSDGTLSGGNYDFAINHNDKSDAAFQRELNNALGEADGDTGAHGGLTPPTHRVGFHISLHHDNDALHVDHFNGAKFPVGTLLHAIVDVGVGSIFYGSHQAFPYAGVQ